MSGNRIAPRPSNKTSDACDAFYLAGLWRARRAAALPRGAAPAPCCDPGAGHHKNKFEPRAMLGSKWRGFQTPIIQFDLHAIAAAAATALRVVPTCRRPRVWARRAGGSTQQARPKKIEIEFGGIRILVHSIAKKNLQRALTSAPTRSRRSAAA